MKRGLNVSSSLLSFYGPLTIAPRGANSRRCASGGGRDKGEQRSLSTGTLKQTLFENQNRFLHEMASREQFYQQRIADLEAERDELKQGLRKQSSTLLTKLRSVLQEEEIDTAGGAAAFLQLPSTTPPPPSSPTPNNAKTTMKNNNSSNLCVADCIIANELGGFHCGICDPHEDGNRAIFWSKSSCRQHVYNHHPNIPKAPRLKTVPFDPRKDNPRKFYTLTGENGRWRCNVCASSGRPDVLISSGNRRGNLASHLHRVHGVRRKRK